MEVRVQSSYHSDRIEDPAGRQRNSADDRVQKAIFRGNIHFAGFDGHFLTFIVDLVAIGGDNDRAVAVDAADVAACLGHKNVSDLRVSVGLRVRQGVMLALGGDSEIDDFAFPHAPGRSQPDSEDPQRAFASNFSHDHADLRRADLDPHQNVRTRHLSFSGFWASVAAEPKVAPQSRELPAAGSPMRRRLPACCA